MIVFIWKTFNSVIVTDSEAAAKVMVELLGSYTEDNASQARVDAHRYTDVLYHSALCWSSARTVYTCVCLIFRCIVRALKDPNTFLMDHLLTLKPVRFLEGELIHDVSMLKASLDEMFLLSSHVSVLWSGYSVCLGWIYDKWLCLPLDVLLHWHFSASFQLLTIFVSAKLASYMKFYQNNKDFIDSLGK